MAHQAAVALATSEHPAVRLALAAWARELVLSTHGHEILAHLPPVVAQSSMPSQARADQWATENTLGLITAFPANVEDPDLALVLASALATKVNWTSPYEVIPDAPGSLGGPFASMVNTYMLSSPDDHCRLYKTSKGVVGAHMAQTDDGSAVISVIGPTNLSPADLFAAAYETAQGDATPADLFDLDLSGPKVALTHESPGWSLVEGSWSGPQPGQEVRARLVAWRAERSADRTVLDNAPGMDILSPTIMSMVDVPLAPQAVQTAVAEFSSTGFEAAAVTAIMHPVVWPLSLDLPTAWPLCASTIPTPWWPSLSQRTGPGTVYQYSPRG